MEEKDIVAINRIKEEINKIDKRENTLFFFVVDTKGTPNGKLEYEYKLAMILKNQGYNVRMLYQKMEASEEFVGVGEWLGEPYASLPHDDVSSEEVKVSPSDILFIPELFTNIMSSTKSLPCKKVMILQSYDYMVEQMPFSGQLKDFLIVDCISNTTLNKNLLKDVFPYVKTTVIDPYIDNIYGSTKEPKEMVINIISNNQEDINKIIKPFYWKYPMYKWVSFRDLRGFPKEQYSKMLRESAITIWVDEETDFGYGALEAMKSGSLVIGKVTKSVQDWMINKDNNDLLNNSCVWFDSFKDLPRLLASVIRAWITDKMPEDISNDAHTVLNDFTYEKTEKQILSYVENLLEERKDNMNTFITQIKNK